MSAPKGETVTLSIAEVESLTQAALVASNTEEANARAVTRSVVAAMPHEAARRFPRGQRRPQCRRPPAVSTARGGDRHGPAPDSRPSSRKRPLWRPARPPRA